jgi:hypothetical protein
MQLQAIPGVMLNPRLDGNSEYIFGEVDACQPVSSSSKSLAREVKP